VPCPLRSAALSITRLSKSRRTDAGTNGGEPSSGSGDLVHKVRVTGRTIRVRQAVGGRVRPMGQFKYPLGDPRFHFGRFPFLPDQSTDATDGNDHGMSGHRHSAGTPSLQHLILRDD